MSFNKRFTVPLTRVPSSQNFLRQVQGMYFWRRKKGHHCLQNFVDNQVVVAEDVFSYMKKKYFPGHS
jgi:hypothetical protein